MSSRIHRGHIVFACAALPCLLLLHPARVLAQAEELPPELGGERPAPALPAPPPSHQPTPGALPESAAPPSFSLHNSLLLLPYLGLSLPVGDASFNVSPRFGALLGWRASDRLSLNVECDVDYGRLETGAGGQSAGADFWHGFWDPPRHYIDLTASPLLALRAGQIRLGPKLGWFTGRATDESAPISSAGLVLGFNAGLFAPYHGVTIGGMLTGSFRIFTSSAVPAGAHQSIGLLAGVLL
ncbi:MAG: hypothetical protein ABSB49_10850 [Polyangia bacterium]